MMILIPKNTNATTTNINTTTTNTTTTNNNNNSNIHQKQNKQKQSLRRSFWVENGRKQSSAIDSDSSSDFLFLFKAYPLKPNFLYGIGMGTLKTQRPSESTALANLFCRHYTNSSIRCGGTLNLCCLLQWNTV